MKTAVWKRYLITALIGAGIALLFLLARGSFAKADQVELYKDFSDAFFIPGVLLAGIGGMIFVSENGIFDMIRFGVSKVVSLLRSEKHRAETPKNFYDYLQRKSEKPRAKYGFLLFSGIGFLVVAVFFAFM